MTKPEIPNMASPPSVVRRTKDGVDVGSDDQVAKVVADFIKAIAEHRDWSRESRAKRVPG
jgi:hypothetical protein